MKLLLSLLATLPIAQAVMSSDFHQWAVGMNKAYAADPSSKEYQTRKANFAANLLEIEIQQKASPSATFGPNKFSDMSAEEFAPRRNGFKGMSKGFIDGCLADVTTPQPTQMPKASGLPTEFDWRTHSPNPVTPVKDQGQCGSCWAFSSIGAIEGAWALAHNQEAQSMAEQSIVDCSMGCALEGDLSVDCNAGCNGGWQWTAYNDIITMKNFTWTGVPLEADYPYTAETGSCQGNLINNQNTLAVVTNFTCITPYNSTHGANEDTMANILVANGPLSFAMDATPLQSYSGGIVDTSTCNPKNLDHAMLIVGFGVKQKTPYWIVKNSWGEGWGESGYFKIARGKGMCGIQMAVSLPIVSAN